MISIAAEIKKIDEREERIRRYLAEEAQKNAEYRSGGSCQGGSCGCCDYCTDGGY